MAYEKTFQTALQEVGLLLTKEQEDAFLTYKDILLEWNEKMNLTAIKDDEGIAIKHFVDSILVLTKISMEGKSVIDVGTGAGFPGIPLKIVEPTIALTLLDALKKRTAFLEEAVKATALQEVDIVWSRAEIAAKDPKYREAFDMTVSRAVAPLNILLEYTLPFLKVGGILVAQKGDNYEEEIKKAQNALKVLRATVIDIHVLQLPVSRETRSLIIIQKQEQTPKKYPRNAGTPSKNPL